MKVYLVIKLLKTIENLTKSESGRWSLAIFIVILYLVGDGFLNFI